MLISFDNDRPSASPFIERVWTSHSERAGTFLSVACVLWEMVITRLEGRSVVTLRGPETRPGAVFCPANGEWLAIRFKAGTFMPQVPVHGLMDSPGVNLPRLSKRSFLPSPCDCFSKACRSPTSCGGAASTITHLS